MEEKDAAEAQLQQVIGTMDEPCSAEELPQQEVVNEGGEKEEEQLQKSQDEVLPQQDHGDAGEENVLLPLLKAMFPHVDDKVIAEVMEASGGDGDLAINLLMTVGDGASQSSSQQRHSSERSDLLTSAYAWHEPQIVVQEEPDFDPSIDAPFLTDVPRSPTIVSPYGEHGGRCGYCHKSATGRISWGMTAIKVRIDDYEAMQDLGWTRSGTWMYHPSNDKACCPQYVIRLDVAKFVPSKQHKHVLAKMQRFLSDINNTPENFKHQHDDQHQQDDAANVDVDVNALADDAPTGGESSAASAALGEDSADPPVSGHDEAGKAILAGVIRQAVRLCAEAGEIPVASADGLEDVIILSAANDRERKRKGDFSSNVAFKLLALYNQSAAVSASAAESDTKEKGKDRPKEAEDDDDGGESERSLLRGDESTTGHERSGVAKRPRRENAKLKKNEKRKADMGQTSAIASKLLVQVERALEDEETAARVKSHFGDEGLRAAVAGPWINFFVVASPHHDKPKTELRPSQFTEESYDLYRKYTMLIHSKEEASEKGYADFLCNTPLFDDPLHHAQGEPVPPSGGYGSYHQYYRLDGKLIAVGVLDFLHSCLTSVYFFYDPDYAFLSLGVYSALKEIELVQQTSLDIPRFKYYYMAYYIYDCPKMNYKAKYRPSDLMCPFYREWVPLEECIPRFQASAGRFTPLVEREEPPPEAERLPIDCVPVLHEGCLVGFNQIGGRLRARVLPLVEQWLSLVTADIASRVVLSVRRR